MTSVKVSRISALGAKIYSSSKFTGLSSAICAKAAEIINRIKNNESENFKKIDKVLLPKDYVRYYYQPYPPELYSPLSTDENEVGLLNQPIFSWEDVDGADEYLIQLSSNQNNWDEDLIFEETVSNAEFNIENYNFESYYMVGISGGGWTTTLSAAIDDRISKSYSVAGTSPGKSKPTKMRGCSRLPPRRKPCGC